MSERMDVYLYACKTCSAVKAHPIFLSEEELRKLRCDSFYCGGGDCEFAQIKIGINPLDIDEHWFYYES